MEFRTNLRHTKEQALPVATKLGLSTAKYIALKKFTEEENTIFFPSCVKFEKKRKERLLPGQ